MMTIALVNRSTRVTNGDALLMADAVQIQMDVHVAPAWDRLPAQVRYYEDEDLVPDGAYVIVLLDNSDQQGALGWHTEGPGGAVFSQVFASPVLDAGGGVLDGGTAGVSVASVVSHEAIEAFVDPSVNVWVDGIMGRDGGCYAYEACDPVEGDSYDIVLPVGPKVSVSAFVTPAWFDLEAAPDAPRSYPNGLTKGPFKLAPGGYMVVRQDPGSEKQVFAEQIPPAWRMNAKANNTASRTKVRITRGIVYKPERAA